jgi:uncharacterized protein (DUF2147 family)
MKKLFVVAALLMAATAAHAGNSISFEIEGHKVRIEAPKNCDSLSCIQISAPGLSGSGFGFKSFKTNDDDVAVRADPPAQTLAPAPAVQAAAPQPTAPVASIAAPASNAVASNGSMPSAGYDVPSTSSAAPPTPLGVWATEENKGEVRVEPCGQDLCGYAVKTGEKILINMRPQDSKWVGRIHDPDSGRNYDSTIAMKGPNALRVQGCAFGGMFCGGQTWKRLS